VDGNCHRACKHSWKTSSAFIAHAYNRWFASTLSEKVSHLCGTLWHTTWHREQFSAVWWPSNPTVSDLTRKPPHRFTADINISSVSRGIKKNTHGLSKRHTTSRDWYFFLA
jgi:hypothetical protein